MWQSHGPITKIYHCHCHCVQDLHSVIGDYHMVDSLQFSHKIMEIPSMLLLLSSHPTHSSIVLCSPLAMVVSQCWGTPPEATAFAFFLSISVCIVLALMDPFRCACNSLKKKKQWRLITQVCSVSSDMPLAASRYTWNYSYASQPQNRASTKRSTWKTLFLTIPSVNRYIHIATYIRRRSTRHHCVCGEQGSSSEKLSYKHMTCATHHGNGLTPTAWGSLQSSVTLSRTSARPFSASCMH